MSLTTAIKEVVARARRHGWASSDAAQKEIEKLEAQRELPYRERLLALWQETDARSGKYVAECSGAMKDLLLELGMEWNEASGEYIFP